MSDDHPLKFETYRNQSKTNLSVWQFTCLDRDALGINRDKPTPHQENNATRWDYL